MKKIFFLLAILTGLLSAQAQFSSANLQASGLTCAMCTKAINKSLEQLSFIESVKPDIQNSAFNIVFKKDAAVDIDRLRKSVEDAGFSVAKLKLLANFNNVAVSNDDHITVDNKVYHFVGISKQVLNGKKEITMVEKDFLTAKEYKKYSTATKMPCLQTGKASDCCVKDGIAAGTRIYHVTI
jgi:copper chaperone CopZ